MGRPWIGITTYQEQARYTTNDAMVALLPAAYAQSVHRAGGRAVLITPDDPGIDALDRLDGLILSGGSDVDSARYGEPPHAMTVPRPDRDTSEFLLLDEALRRDLPVLAICRGMQVLTAAYGGKLHQHLPDVLGHTAHRPDADRPGPVFGEHAVRLEPGTRTHKILGGEVVVNSLHHQGIADPGRLTPSGWCVEDSLLEAAEDPDHSFVVGVQWHPEAMTDPRLFEALVAAASGQR
jgi:putative glutamine amidotransferase